MRTRFFLTTFIFFGFAGHALAEDLEPQLSAGDSRIKMLEYNEADVYTINTRYGYQTNVVFGPSEEIQTISVGDRSVWQIIPTGNRMFIRPMEEGASTNMTVITSKHSYQFDLKSASADKPSETVYVAKFIYPDATTKTMEKTIPAGLPAAAAAAAMPSLVATPPTIAAMPSAPPMHTAAVAPPPGAFNYHYTYAGPDELAPLQVFDNGQSTFIRYRDMNQPLPNAYIVDAQGNEWPTTYYVKDQLMVLNTVAGELALKNGNGTVKIYNEVLNPR